MENPIQEDQNSNLALPSTFFEAALAAMSDYVYAFNRQRRFVYVNRAMQSLFGTMPLLGKTFLELDYPQDLAQLLNGHIDQIFKTGETIDHEVFYTAPTGKSAWFNYSWSPVPGAGGAVDLVIGVSRDVTEKRNVEQQQEIVKVSLSTLEEERRRISESLHNGLGQVLYGVKISLSGLTLQQTEADFHKTKNYTNQLLSEAIIESRRISHELMPTTLEEFGLDAALQDICEQMNGEVKFACKVQGLNIRLERYLELAIYRTVQELMTNVVKHADATQCNIDITATDKAVKIRVQDDGQGMDAAKGQKPGIGLASIRSKIKLLNGRVGISNNKGALVEIDIPLQNKPGI